MLRVYVLFIYFSVIFQTRFFKIRVPPFWILFFLSGFDLFFEKLMQYLIAFRGSSKILRSKKYIRF